MLARHRDSRTRSVELALQLSEDDIGIDVVAGRPRHASSFRFTPAVNFCLSDELQSITSLVPTATKLEWLRAAYVAGLREIEVGSLVPPRLLPQLADTADVVVHTLTLEGLTVSVLVPNSNGAQRAMEGGPHILTVPVSRPAQSAVPLAWRSWLRDHYGQGGQKRFRCRAIQDAHRRLWGHADFKNLMTLAVRHTVADRLYGSGADEMQVGLLLGTSERAAVVSRGACRAWINSPMIWCS